MRSGNDGVESVAGSSFGDDVGGIVGVDFYFAAQAVDVDVEPVFLGVLEGPDAVEQEFGGDDAAGVSDEDVEQFGFCGGEGDGTAVYGGFPVGEVDHEPVVDEGGGVEGVGVIAHAAQDAVDAGYEFAGVEGFDDVVFGVLFQPFDDGFFVVDGREQDDGHVAEFPYFPAKFKAAHDGHVEVYDGEVGDAVPVDDFERILPGNGRYHLITRLFQRVLHNAQRERIVVNR